MDMLQLKINPRLLGPRVGNKVQSIIKKSKDGDWVKKGDSVFVDDFELFDGEYDIELLEEEDLSTQSIETTDYIIKLNLEITKELENEGISRDIIRAVQNIRREKDFDISDNISLLIKNNNSLENVIFNFKEFICRQVLAKDIKFHDFQGINSDFNDKIQNFDVELFISKEI